MSPKPVRLGLLLLWPAAALHAQGVGVSSVGASGGLHIPSAYVLGTGEAAASLGNEQDPRLGTFGKRQNYTVGFGLGGGLELFGRVAEYQNPSYTPAGAPDVAGPRDLSANLKWQLPIDAPGIPKLAVGVTDLSGGAVYFKSVYAVASDELGPLRWSLGYARGTAALDQPGGAKVLDGVFGGGELRLWNTGATALLESDGSRRHAGLRYYSASMSWLGDAQLIGTVQRSFGVNNSQGQGADANSFNLSLVMPLQTDDATRTRRALNAAKAQATLPPIDASATVPPDALERLLTALRAGGLERVRVGTLNSTLVVEYENQRYTHNEVDALGLVLGLAAELAPPGVNRVNALTLKLGQVVFETSVSVADLRAYLRDGNAASVLASLGAGRLSGFDADAVNWVNHEAEPSTRLRVALRPLLNHTEATEFGLFDYSLALQTRLSTPLWRGAQAYADLIAPLANSSNMDSGRVFDDFLHRSGVQTLALQQSFWYGPHMLNTVGVGRYRYEQWGAEAESILFVPGRPDTVHLRGQYARASDQPRTPDLQAWSAAYRWQPRSDTWLEGGVNEYTDGTRGPSMVVTRWFGDVSLQMFGRKGGANTFVGLNISLPLGPRQGMGASPVQLVASPRFATSVRTVLTNANNAGNYIRPNAVRPADLSYQSDEELRNAGRLSPDYLRTQLPRLREAFYLYGRDLLP